MRLLLHILLSGIFCIFAVSCAKESSSPPEKLLEQAYEAAASNSWKRALDLAQMAEKIRPDDTSVLIMLSLAQENNGYEDDAFETIRKAAADEKSFMAQYTVGRMLYQRGRYEGAYSFLKKAQSLKPDDINTLLLLEQTAARLNKNDVQTYCALLWRQFPDHFKNSPFVMNELGLFFAIRRDAVRAIAAFRNAEKVDPDSPEIQLNLAVVHDYLADQRQSAIRHYEKYLRLTANRPGLEADRLEVTRRLQEIR